MSFKAGGRTYTHKKCEDGHVRKANQERDWTEQDVCPTCDATFDLYDPKRKKTATEDARDDAADGHVGWAASTRPR